VLIERRNYTAGRRERGNFGRVVEHPTMQSNGAKHASQYMIRQKAEALTEASQEPHSKPQDARL
jgi:hypothetical protein